MRANTPTGRCAHLAGLCAILATGCADGAVSPETDVPPRLQALVPDTAYAAWFERHTGIVPSGDGFGVYGLEAHDGRVFVGLAATRPARGDGALLAVADGSSLTAIGALDEQGFTDMTMVGDRLVVAGADPCCGDDWSLGNVYLYDPADGLRKHRSMPNVIHGFGVWHDGDNGATYMATGSHAGDEATWTGAVWRSRDSGETWSLVADRDDGVGEARAYDVLGVGDALYANISDSLIEPGCRLVVRRQGALWTAVTDDRSTACYPRIVRFGAATVALSSSRSAVQAAADDGAVAHRALPFRAPEWAIRWGVAVGDVLYALTDEGSVVRTGDLDSWETVVSSPHELISIEYWPDRDWLVVGGAGASAGLWRLDLTPEPSS